MITTYLLLLVAAFATNIGASDSGFVCLGRTVFEPLCCYACLSSFWGLRLSCTTVEAAEGARGSNATCHSTNPAYLSSLAYCLHDKCAADNVSSIATSSCWNKVAGDGIQVGDLEMHLPVSAPTAQLGYNATTLEEASLVDDGYYVDSRTTIKGYVKQESVHALYG